jgi:predicted O-methyltransferase YrrM
VPLPKAIRSRTPNRIRDNPSLRALALASGLIPPRPMHTVAEAELLKRLASDAKCVVEIGVFEGSSAFVFCDVLAHDAQLHLIDPFGRESGAALLPGWRATESATRRAVARRTTPDGPQIHWHIARSQDAGRRWRGPAVDLVFVDGDHSTQGCREDWDVWHGHVRPGGTVAFHDARRGLADGTGSPGPTEVVSALFRGTAGRPVPGWELSDEIDSLVVVRRRGHEPQSSEDREH